MAERNDSAGERRNRRGAGKAMADTIEAAKEKAQSAVQEGAERLASEAGAAAEAVQRNAGRLGEELREAAQSIIGEQQQRIADMVHGLAEALHCAALTLQREDKASASRYAEQASARIDRFAETVRHQQLKDLVASTEDFARRQPALFLAGAVAAGFLIGRALAPATSAARPAPAQAFATSAGQGDDHPGRQPADEPMAGHGPGADAEPS